MYDRFLDGYDHALDGSRIARTAAKVADNVSTLSTMVSLASPSNLENSVYFAQSAGNFWGKGAAIFAPAASKEIFLVFFLEGLAFKGAGEVGKITAGLTNLYNDAY